MTETVTPVNTWNPLEHLTKKHTKQLMGYLGMCRKFGGFYSPFDNANGVTIDQVKAELATREHVPNKHEAKAIRQAKAKNNC